MLYIPMQSDQEFLTKLDEVIEQATKMHEVLFQDARQIAGSIVSSNSQTDYRNYIRSVMAYVEGMTFRLKQTALTLNYLELNSNIESSELALLKEESYSLDKSSRPKTASLRLPMKENVRFSIEIFAKVIGSDNLNIFESTGWNSICQSIETRHRLTHPKKIEDLSVTRMEIDLASTALKWYADCIEMLFNFTSETLHSNTENIRQNNSNDV